MKDDIQKKNLVSLVEHEPTVDGKVLVWHTSMLDILDHHAPIQIKNTTVRPNTAWFTEEISQKKRERRRAEAKWRRKRLTIDEDMFRAAKTATKKAITLAKSTYLRETIATNKGISKDLWKIVNGLTKSATSTSTLPEHCQKSELAERFNVFFKQAI